MPVSGFTTAATIWLLASLTGTPPRIQEAVTVTAPALASPDRATMSFAVPAERLVQLPLNGRSFVPLLALAPGVGLPPGSQLPRINGGRPRVNEYLYDGVSVLQPEPGQAAFLPVVEAIDQIRIETNAPAAEFGRFNGGVISLTTKSGSNVLHGAGFDFVRHEALSARNYFAPAHVPVPRFRRQQFGGVLGGPLRRDRAFFFADYQGQRQRIGRTMISTVPTLLQRQGTFTEPIGGQVPIIYDPATTIALDGGASRTPFPGNRIPADRIDPVARALLDRYPRPTSEGAANNYRRIGDEVTDSDQFDFRADQRLTTRDEAFVRVSRLRERVSPVAPLPDGSGAASGTLGPQRTGVWSIASQYRRTLSSRLLNELRVGDTRRTVHRTAVDIPAFLVSGYQHLGSPPNTAADFQTGVTHLADAVTWVRGRHAVKFGADLRWERLDIVQPPSPAGQFQFTSLFTDLPGVPGTGSPFASFLLGQVQTFSIDLQAREIRNRAHAQEYFVQDDWRLTDRVTVNAGLRYTLNFPSTEENDQAAVFNLTTETLDYLGREGRPRSARRVHTTDFGPRLGVVGHLTATTEVRAGYGLIWIEQAGITTPFTTPAFPFLQTVSQRTLDGIAPAFVLAGGPTVAALPLTADAGLGQGVFAVDRNLGSGYVEQWNVGVQRAITPRMTAGVAYVGSRITRAGVPDSNLNQLSVEQLGLGPLLQQRVPNPYFGAIPRSSSIGDETLPLAQLLKPYPRFTTVSLYRHNVGSTAYHGLEAHFDRRLTAGLSVQASYTWSRLKDDASAVFDASVLTGPVANYPMADSFNRAGEWDDSNGDIPHVFASSVVWTVKDWTLAGILRAQSGVPVAVTQATNFNAFAGFGTQRPNRAANPQLARGARSPARWFNTDAFAVAPPFTLGSSSRNPVRGPGFRTLDLAVIRRIAIRGDRALELRGEVFNATNTAAFGNPNGVFGTPAFGTITSAGDPRVIQLAVKVHF
jgi:hypothetical protein